MTLEDEYENNNNDTETDVKEIPFKTKVYQKMCNFAEDMKMLFEQPYLKYLGITCFVDFGLMAR
jgi:hypothetical protein